MVRLRLDTRSLFRSPCCSPRAFAPVTAHAVGGVGDLYVTSDASNVVRAYLGTWARR